MVYSTVTGHLVSTLWCQTEFWSGNHSLMLNYGRADIRHHNSLKFMWVLVEKTEYLLATELHRLHRGRKTGAYITVQTPRINRMEIGVQV